ncbi:MAG: isocitrate lyase/PEP mutase family protein [Burkholderiaceae bacterium]|nr:isocitrate lyase/PEP mutase family protein [Burkholderiaceae bacterium]
MSPNDKRKNFRDLLASDRCVIAGSVFDPLSARIAHEVGFEVGLLGGSVASFAVLGAPDLTLLTLTELAEQTRRICRATDLPVLVDADHGYGNALNVMRTVEEVANAGAAGLSIEDTLLPRAFGSTKESSLTSVEEGVGKMRAAMAAARDSGIAVFGRTGAVALTDLDDAVRRLQAYERAGVDALFVPYLKTRHQLDQISTNTRLPIILGGPGAELVDFAYLASRRVRVCLRGHQAFAASVQALYDTAQAVLAGTAPEKLRNVAPDSLMARLTQAAEHERLSDEFLKP